MKAQNPKTAEASAPPQVSGESVWHQPIIARVTQSHSGQRRVTIPREVVGVQAGDWVELRKVEFRWCNDTQAAEFPAAGREDSTERGTGSVVQERA